MNSPGADRNLLYGVMALRMGLVAREPLMAAMTRWADTPTLPLGVILVEQHGLSPQDHEMVNMVVERLLEAHGDASSSLTALDYDLIDPSGDLRRSIASGHTPRDSDPFASRGDTVQAINLGDTVAWSQSDPGGVLQPSDRRPGRTRPEKTSERFRILRLHARGGLGEVYLARDEELDRTVALKEIRPEYAAIETLRERFVREAEINGNLEHPAIVPVYALGNHADGRPFYAMRFVEGETLQVALDRFHAQSSTSDDSAWMIGLRGLLRRFLAICDAIDYAHSRGVLHRDLKPSNIMLGKFGESLIIDWGLGKYLGKSDTPAGDRHEGSADEPPDDRASSTVAGETMGSPPFMSPEQARGDHDHLQPSSDIYSLGATLYAVVTGKAPVVNLKVKEILERVARGEIPPPVEANPRVPRALDAICRKAMRTAPDQRYATARALAEDLERWLDDRPVAVYDDPVSTRVLRWSRHHKSLVAASLAIMIASVVGLAIIAAVISQQKGRAEIARLQAENARTRAGNHLRDGLAVFDQLVTLGDRQLITQTNAAKRTQFLSAANSFIRRVRLEEPQDLSLQVQTASLARRLGNLHRLTGHFLLGDPFYDEAVAVLKNVSQREPSPTYRDLLAETLIDQGDSWLTRGQAVRAAAIFGEALAIARQNAESSPGHAAFARTLSRGAVRLAEAHRVMGLADVVDLATQATLAVKPLADAALPTARDAVLNGQILPLTDQLELVQALSTLAEGREQGEEFPQAEDQLNQALQRMNVLRERFRGIDVLEIDYFHAWVQIHLARVITRQDASADRALTLLENATAVLAPLQSAHPEFPHFQATMAEAQCAAASIHERKGQIRPARDQADAARSTLARLVETYPDVPEYAGLLAESLAILGRLADRDGVPQQARAFFEQAVKFQSVSATASPENVLFKTRLEQYRNALKAASQAL